MWTRMVSVQTAPVALTSEPEGTRRTKSTLSSADCACPWQSNVDPKYLAIKNLIKPDAADAELGDVDLDDGSRRRGRSRSREPEELPQPEPGATPPAPPGRPWDAPVAVGPSRVSDVYEDDDDDGRRNSEAHQHEPDSP